MYSNLAVISLKIFSETIVFVSKCLAGITMVLQMVLQDSDVYKMSWKRSVKC